MAETFTPLKTANLSNQSSITQNIDNNFETVSTLFQDVVSRSGSQPNQMGSPLDMNSNPIINLPPPATANSPVRLVDINSVLTPTPAIISGSNTYTGNNSFSGDTTFSGSATFTSGDFPVGAVIIKNGHPWVDVTAWGTNVGQGNGAVDTAAFQAAINYSQNNGALPIFIPGGSFIITSSLTATISTFPIIIQGSGKNSTELTTGGADVTIFDTSGGGGGFDIRDVFIVGKGVSDTGTFGATKPLVKGGPLNMRDCYVWGGAPPIYIQNFDDNVFFNVNASFGYGSSILYTKGSGNWYIRCKFDQEYPFNNQVPTNIGTYSSWTTNTSYTAGEIATISSYIVQCMTSGTSNNSSAPALKNYGQTITDGSGGLTWQLMCPQNYIAAIVDSGCNQNSFFELDATGCFFYGLLIEDSLSTGAPNLTTVSDSNFGVLGTGIWALKGSGLNVVNSNFSAATASLASSSFGLKQDSTFTGNTIFNANIMSGCNFPIDIVGGSNTVVSGNVIVSAAGSGNVGISIAANVQGFVINSNVIESTSTAIAVGGGTNYYNIANNVVYGRAVGGTTTTTTFVGNNT